MRTIHKICHLLREYEASDRGMEGQKAKEHARCKECPAWGDYGKEGCRLKAEEMLNVVKYGQPWGRKYRYTRKSWPDRSKYSSWGIPRHLRIQRRYDS